MALPLARLAAHSPSRRRRVCCGSASSSLALAVYFQRRSSAAPLFRMRCGKRAVPASAFVGERPGRRPVAAPSRAGGLRLSRRLRCSFRVLHGGSSGCAHLCRAEGDAVSRPTLSRLPCRLRGVSRPPRTRGDCRRGGGRRRRAVDFARALDERCAVVAREWGLSAREGELLPLLVMGMSATEVGSRLFIAPQTVKTHRYRIYRKAGVGTHAELVELVSQSTASSEGSQ